MEIGRLLDKWSGTYRVTNRLVIFGSGLSFRIARTTGILSLRRSLKSPYLAAYKEADLALTVLQTLCLLGSPQREAHFIRRLACQPEPGNGNPNLPNRGVHVVAQSQKWRPARTTTQRPHVLMARYEPLHTWKVGLKRLTLRPATCRREARLSVCNEFLPDWFSCWNWDTRQLRTLFKG